MTEKEPPHAKAKDAAKAQDEVSNASPYQPSHPKANDSQASEGQEPKSPAALREEAILAFWNEKRIFEKSLTKQAPKGTFVTYDGPPYATGAPHFGHLLPSTMKDAIPRFKTMQGYTVPRKWGWDCHGLPIENLIEKELGLSDKKAIIDYGIDKFNTAARNSVFTYDKEWKKVIHRMGRWVDMENNYLTMDSSYTESVWWSFKNIYDKGLIYEGFKSMHICPRCETTLSNFEVGQGYQDVTDISVYVLFALKKNESAVTTSEISDMGTGDSTEYALAWTTTPWTLHGNIALAVNPEMIYVKIKISNGDHAGKTVILAESRLEALVTLAKLEYEILAKMSGMELAETYPYGYHPVFDTYQKNKFPLEAQEEYRNNAWKIQVGEFVTADAGTGIVHIAPGFGEDDMKLSQSNNLPMVHHVGLDGHARAELGEPFAGKMVKPKEDPQSYDINVIKALAHAGNLFAKEKIIHSYPHCWRCNFPLLNYATSGWFFETTHLKQRMLDENSKVKWMPEEIGTGRFGTWLENVRDWNVSRSRFWGAPIPVWRGENTGKIEVIASFADLKSKIQKRNSYTLMRHGESESNVLGLSCSKDLTIHGLTELGKKQVEESISSLKSKKRITKIYSSDFLRTKESAYIAADMLGIPREDIVFDARLREWYAGSFDGRSWNDVYATRQHLSRKEHFLLPIDSGESVYDVKKRSTEFLYDIDANNSNEDILIVTHGLPLRMMKYTSEGKNHRDLIRTGWQDVSDPNASLHGMDWRQLPHNDTLELDVHRPYIDQVTWIDAETEEKMVRIPDVFDVWYDSGSMPFAQNHYPFECKTDDRDSLLEKGSALFPADFIAEGLDQTRGWFYSLLAINVGLFDMSPYKAVTVNGLILAEDGRKMSKSLRNYPDLWPTIQKYGADSIRYFLASTPAVRGEEVAFSEKSLDEVNKKVFNRLDNIYSFLTMYAVDANGELLKGVSRSYEEKEIEDIIKNLSHPLDLWVVARLNQTMHLVTENLNKYVLDKATRPITEFIDDVSTWYLRRSRDRFKSGGDYSGPKDREDAIFTTRFILERLSRLMAPVTPFMAEDIYKKVRFGMIESVHLESWPDIIMVNAKDSESNLSRDLGILESMTKVRALVETGLAQRAASKIKVRQPLASFAYDHAESNLTPELEDIIKDELNVKAIVHIAAEGRAPAKSSDDGLQAVLDINLTDDLKEEGIVRDIIRAIQQERKNKNLMPQDPIQIVFDCSESMKAIVEKYASMLEQAVLARTIVFSGFTDVETGTPVEAEINGKSEVISFLITV